MSFLLAAVLAAGPFPLPTVDGKPLAVTAKQTTFRLPMRFERVRDFYAEQFKGESVETLSVRPSGTTGSRTLALVSKRPGDSWTKAVVKEGEGETVVVVTPLLRLGATEISGSGKPLVQFVFGRAAEAAEAARAIDHTESMRAK